MTSETEILQAARGGDLEGLWVLLEGYRQRLERMVQLRLHPRVRGRADPADVVQDAFLEISTSLDGYLEEVAMPFFLWVRFRTGRKLAQVHRRHLDAEKRDARREARIADSVVPAASSIVLANALIDSGISPSQAAVRAEDVERLRESLDAMKELDREILALRHFENLSNSEVAQVLDLKESTASQRYLRALDRLSQMMESPEGPQ